MRRPGWGRGTGTARGRSTGPATAGGAGGCRSTGGAPACPPGRAEAARKLRQLLAARHDLPGGGTTTTLTLGDPLARWLKAVEYTRKPRTHRLYHDLARLHLLPSLGTTELAALQPGDVQQLYEALLVRRLAPTTVRNVHHVLHGALQRGVDWRLLAANAADGAVLPCVPRKEMAILDVAQMRRLLAVAAEGRWAALVALSLATGMRQGELLGLR